MSRHLSPPPGGPSDERGVTALEYAFIAGIISIAFVGGAALIGDWVLSQFQRFAALF